MALVVEDGTIVTGANSYNDLPALKEYALVRGVELGADDALIEQRAHQAIDYLESLTYKGSLVEPDDQALLFPRSGIYLDGRYLASDTIPRNIKSAQAQLVVELTNGVIIWTSTSSGTAGVEQVVKKEKVDVIETEYMTPVEQGVTGGSVGVAEMPAVYALLRKFLVSFMPTLAYRI